MRYELDEELKNCSVCYYSSKLHPEECSECDDVSMFKPCEAIQSLLDKLDYFEAWQEISCIESEKIHQLQVQFKEKVQPHIRFFIFACHAMGLDYDSFSKHDKLREAEKEMKKILTNLI